MVLNFLRKKSFFQHLNRIPGGEKREVGAGYVMALTAIGVTSLYFLLAGTAILMVAAALRSITFLIFAPIGIIYGAINLSVIVAPILFLTGVTAWKVIPTSQRYGGAIGGLLAVSLAYILAGIVVISLSIFFALLSGRILTDALIGSVGIISVAFLASSWIAFPAFILTGTLYERSLNN